MTGDPITTVTGWTITDADRDRFARVSGDHNPIHTDPIAARRLHGGHLLVHGAHALLEVIGQAAAGGLIDRCPAGLSVTFRHGIRPDTPLITTFETGDGTLRATVSDDGWPAIVIRFDPADLAPTVGEPTPHRPHERPLERGLEDIADAAGTLQVAYDPATTAMVVDAARVLGALRMAEITQISRVVGMHAPGLRSMSSRYDIRFRQPDPTEPATIGYRVSRVDARISRVELSVEGPSMRTRVVAFSPPGPVDQGRLLATGPAPEPGEFSDRRVLVVGGSRGLGEATVRLLTGGGADVRLSYCVGVADAAAVTAATGAEAIPFDAGDGPALTDRLGDWRPNQLCWFATPPTSSGIAGVFAPRFHERLLAVQVTAFERSVAELVPGGLRSVLWPSSELVDRPGADTTELVAVKIAGEAACTRLVTSHPLLVVHSPRLPRLATDSTATLLPVEYAPTAATMLEALRSLPL